MKIVVAGHGRMGIAVEQVVRDRGHHLIGFVSRTAPGDWPTVAAALQARRPEVVIDFTHAGIVEATVAACLEAGVPLVTGTTGWSDRLPDVRALVEAEGGTLLHAPNFSLGVQLFLRVASGAGRLFGRVGAWDVGAFEKHHRGKADAPSGTALELARRLVDAVPSKKRFIADRPDAGIEPEDLHVVSLRVGAEWGHHAVVFDGEDDVIELRHSARGRRGFALGAVRAAEWVIGRKGVFTIDDYIDDVLAKEA